MLQAATAEEEEEEGRIVEKLKKSVLSSFVHRIQDERRPHVLLNRRDC